MSLIYASGSIMETTADAIVNPVNCVGVMGQGLAKAMADRWPHVLAPYEIACRNKTLRPGVVISYGLWPQHGSLYDWAPDVERDLLAKHGPRWMFFFPTKDHWRNPSRVEWISKGLQALTKAAVAVDVQSMAVPALGCGLGGLSWHVVRSMLEQWAASAPFDVRIYPPKTTK